MEVVDQKKENSEIARRYKRMLRHSYRTLSDSDKKLIRKAFDFAAEAHSQQRRKSGEPYIFHPIAVAQIVAEEIGLGAISIAAALMHDVIEDTSYTLEDIQDLFGDEVAKIVMGLTKISVLKNQELSIQSENFKKLLLTLSEDIRVILIKIADRLHNMRTLESLPEHKQLRIASETTFIYAPLAHRMGLYNIKSELEDLSFKYTNPQAYQDIKQNLKDSAETRRGYIQKFSSLVQKGLDKEDFSYEIKGRPKSIYSIHRKIKTQGISFEKVYDKFAIRIIYDSKLENEKSIAWRIYSIITDTFTPNPKRTRDWISQPRSTGYESLHTTVVGPDSHWVEVQIRSRRMDELAEKGIAAHYKYKQNYKVQDSKLDEWITQVREMLESNDTENTREFINNFKLNLYNKEIFIFTPKGDLKSLPKNSTALDFAYSIHSKVGDHCLGAKVNHKLVALSHVLQSGDQVEIITSDQQKPKSSWLDFVVTSRARSKIKSFLNSEVREKSEEGKEQLIRKLRHLKIPFNENTVNDLVRFFGEKTSQDLFYKFGEGIIDNKELRRFSERQKGVYGLIKRIRQGKLSSLNKTPKPEPVSKGDLLVFGEDQEKMDYQLAPCCNPIAGDKVFGFVTVNNGIRVHKNDCPNAVSLRANYGYRILSARWVDSTAREFKANIKIIGTDRLGLINDTTKLITDNLNINIRSFNISSKNGIFEGDISILVKNKNHLEKIIEKLKKVEGVNKVVRSQT